MAGIHVLQTHLHAMAPHYTYDHLEGCGMYEIGGEGYP